MKNLVKSTALVFWAVQSLGPGAAVAGASGPSASQSLALASRAAAAREPEQVIRFVNQALQAPDCDPQAYYLRGRARLQLGQPRQAVADFDEFLKHRPQRARSLWERGIACYYAKQYQDGAQQFAAYQTYDGNDVENAVWHHLCLARQIGFEQAAGKLLRVRHDRRVPMMEIYGLFQGQLTPQAVLAAAEAGPVDDRQRRYQLFYAHLYVGLYFEARGDDERSGWHIRQGAEKYAIDHYMWDVAKAHLIMRKPRPHLKDG